MPTPRALPGGSSSLPSTACGPDTGHRTSPRCRSNSWDACSPTVEEDRWPVGKPGAPGAMYHRLAADICKIKDFDTVEAMAPRKQPTLEDRTDAIRITLSGVASGEEFDSILEKLRGLHVRHSTFRAEELLELASEAIDESGATPADPIDCENIRGRFLPESPFSGRTQYYKSKYAV